MGKNKGSVPCTLCDRTFTSIADMQQHLRDKRHNTPAQVPIVEARPPVQQPQVQVQHEPVPAPAAPSFDSIICDHCLAPFPSPKDLKRHKAVSHGWRCFKCPALPPFEDGGAWQRHFNEVHATGAQPSEVTVTKGKEVAAPTKEDKSSQFVLGDSERSKGSHSGEINGRDHDGGHNTNIEVHNAPAQVEPLISVVGNVTKTVISSPPPEVVALGVTEDKVVSSASDSKATPNSEDQTTRVDERDPLSSKGPTLSILVEIDPGPRRGRDDTTYEIASDVLSPTPSVSSIETDEPEGEYDVEFPLHSFGLPNGSSLEKRGDINIPPHGPKAGDREKLLIHPIELVSRSNANVAGNHSGGEPSVRARDGLGGITPPITKGQYGVDRSRSPTSTTSSSQDRGWDLNQGDLLHDPLRTRRSETGTRTATPEIHFKCRICLSDPTLSSSLTTTLCGHLFCYECIATDILRTSRCPVCKNVLALYCLVKLDMAS